MAFFGLSDITFNKGPPTRNGPLGALVKSDFETTTLRYPLDVGNYDKGHYMVFYIRTQKNTKFTGRGEGLNDNLINSGSGVASGGITNQQSVSKLVNNAANQLNSALLRASTPVVNVINQIRGALGQSSISNPFGQSSIPFGGSSAASQAVFDNSFKKITGGRLDFIKQTSLTKDAIALYMPDSLLYSQQQAYDQLSLGSSIAGQVLAAGKSTFDQFKQTGKITGEMSSSFAKSAAIGAAAAVALEKTGQLGQFVLAQTGQVLNPLLEMVYKSPNFRTFQFDFTFYPRDESEALEVQRIIERFRFHQAPELAQVTRGFLVPPSEFDIRFYYGGHLNVNIPAVATCVLTSIDINYAPNGFAAYEVPGENKPNLGRTGMPVAIQLTLQFQELTYLLKSDFISDDEFEKRGNTGPL